MYSTHHPFDRTTCSFRAGGTRIREFRFIKGAERWLLPDAARVDSPRRLRQREAARRWWCPRLSWLYLPPPKKSWKKRNIAISTPPFFFHLYSRKRFRCSGESPSISPSRRKLDAKVPPPGPHIRRRHIRSSRDLDRKAGTTAGGGGAGGWRSLGGSSTGNRPIDFWRLPIGSTVIHLPHSFPIPTSPSSSSVAHDRFGGGFQCSIVVFLRKRWKKMITTSI